MITKQKQNKKNLPIRKSPKDKKNKKDIKLQFTKESIRT